MRKALGLAKWLGFILTLGGLSWALIWAAGPMQPIRHGDAEVFWQRVFMPCEGMPIEVARRQREWAFLTSGDTYAYATSASPGHPWRGQVIMTVSQADVLAQFPTIIDKVLAVSGEGFSDAQLEALIGHEVSDRHGALADLVQRQVEIAQSREVLEAFVLASDYSLLDSAKGHERLELLASRISCERMFAWLMYQASHYWMNVVFEAFLLAVIALAFWLPILWQRLRRLLPLLWGIIPILLFAPYAFGYCPHAFAFLDTRVEGVLYPALLQVFMEIPIPLRSVGDSWLAYFPNLLGFLNQPLGLPEFLLVASVGPVAPLLMGAGIAVVVGLVQTIGRFAGRAIRRRCLGGEADVDGR